MQRKRASSLRDGAHAAVAGGRSGTDAAEDAEPQGGCYGIQVLVAGRRKHWRDDVSAQIRRAGFNATAVDSAIDALTILVLGLPVDVLVTDSDLQGDLHCARLAREARVLRPNLGIIFARDLGAPESDCVPDALILPPGAGDGVLAVTVREALAARP